MVEPLDSPAGAAEVEGGTGDAIAPIGPRGQDEAVVAAGPPPAAHDADPRVLREDLIYVLAIVLSVGLLALDSNVSLGMAGGVFYVLVMLLTLWMPRYRSTVLLGGLATAFTAIGFFLSPPGAELGQVVVNRSLGVLAIWSTAFVVLLRKRTELLQHLSEGNFRQIATNTHDVFWICSPDWRQMHYISPAYEEVWGRSCASLHADPASWMDGVIEEDRSPVQQAIRTMASGDLTQPELLEYRVRHTDGTVRWIRAHAYPIYDERGRVERIAGIAEDITTRKQDELLMAELNSDLTQRVERRTAELTRINAQLAVQIKDRHRIEANLQESNTRFRQVAENIREVFWMTDVEGQTFIYASPGFEEIWGRTCASLSVNHREWCEPILPEERDEARRRFSGAAGSDGFDIQYRIRRPDGEIRWIHDRGFPVRDEYGKVYRIAGLAQDITKQKEMEQTLHGVIDALSTTTGDDFFASLVVHIADALGTRYALIGDLSDEAPDCVTTLAVCDGERIVENISYQLRGTPCEDVLNQKPCVLSEGVCSAFPDDELLREMNVESYAGVPLVGAGGEVIGLLVILDTEPMRNPERAKTLLNLFAVRAAVELERRRADAALRRSERKYRSIIDTSPDWIWEMDLQGRHTFTNHGLKTVLGYPIDRVENMQVFDLFHPEDRAEINRRLPILIDQRSGWTNWIVRMRHRDGTYRHLESNAVPVYDEHGELSGYRGVDRDITERRRIEEALAQSEEFLQVVGRIAKVGGWELDAETMEIRWTEETYRLHEVALDAQPQLEDAINFYHPGDRPVIRNALQRALQVGEPYDVEVRFITAKGRHLWVNSMCKPHVVDGKTVKLTGTFQDITERRQAEAAERESEMRFRAMFEQAAVGIALFNLEGVYLRVNERLSSILGYTQEELVGRSCKDVTHPEDRAAQAEMLSRLLGGGIESFSIEKRCLRKNATPVWVNLTARPVCGETGEPEYVIAVIEDITERRDAQEALRTSSALLEESQRIAHFGHWTWDIVANTLGWSDEICRIFDLKPQDIGGTYDAFLAGVHPEDRGTVMQAVDAALRGDRPYAIEHRIVRPDGEVRHVFARAEITRDESGQPIHMLGTVQDMTERRQAERKLELTQFGIDNAAVGAFWIRPDGSIVYVNDAACRALEYSSEELLKLSVPDIDTDFPRETWNEHWTEMRQAGAMTFEAHHRTKNGRIFPVEIQTNYLAFKGEEFIWAFVRDITERKQAEERAIGLSHILEESLNEIYVFDAESLRFLRVNRGARENLGYTMDELESMTPLDLNPEETRETIAELVEPLQSGHEKIICFQTFHRRKDGTRYDVEVHLQCATLGRHTVFVTIILDITARKRNEERQSLLMRELDHRVKNNLASVISIADHTSRHASSMIEFKDAFNGRIASMALAHEMLAQQHWEGAELEQLVERVVAPYRRDDAALVQCEGPVVLIPAAVAPSLSMVFHELATNAAKYGALASTNGYVTICWTIRSDDQNDEILNLTWQESGGPPVIAPTGRGYGSMLIERMIEYQLNGKASLTFEPTGVRCQLQLPLAVLGAVAT